MPIAYRNSWRVVKVSMRNAVIGIMMPLVSMNPVVSHCTVLAGVVLLELAGWWSRPQRWPARNCVTSIIKSRFLG